MASQVSISNLALARIAAGASIESVDEASNEARYAKAFFDHCRQAVLREHDWAFARGYVQLAITGTTTSTSWSYQYKYPNNIVAVRNIEKPYVGQTIWNDRTEKVHMIQGSVPYEVGVNSSGVAVILCDYEDAVAHVTMDVTDTSLFDPLFVDALAWRLAQELVPPLSASNEYFQLAARSYEMAISKAKAASGSEDRQDYGMATSIQARM